MTTTTERAAAMRMPAEWAPHDATLIAWPAREEAWHGATIEQARDAHAATIAAVAEFEPVLLVAHPDHLADARRPHAQAAHPDLRRLLRGPLLSAGPGAGRVPRSSRARTRSPAPT